MGFETFLGNTVVVAEMRAMLATGRIPGALLFSGPEGVGKKTLALMLAKAMNCRRRGENGSGKDDFCGECALCRKADEMLAATREDLDRRRAIKDSARRVEGLVYFDLQLIEPITRFILIDQVRKLREVAYTRPFEFPHRVFVIDQAHALHWQAVDLLLKVLEEPPETTTIILVTANSHELRPTIRSRCRKIQFLPVEETAIAKLLEERGGFNKAHLALAARVAAGSVAVAKSFDPAQYQRERQPWLDLVGVIAGKTPDSVNSMDWKIIFDATKILAENRDQFDRTLQTGYTLLRDLMQVFLAGPPSGITNVDLMHNLKSWAPKLGLNRIEKLKAGLDSAFRLQTRNVNQQLGLDALATEVLGQQR